MSVDTLVPVPPTGSASARPPAAAGWRVAAARFGIGGGGTQFTP
jgi:hypothetical protein